MKSIVITGASSGIGLETARVLVKEGYQVIGIGRDEQRCKKALEALLAESPSQKPLFFVGDLMQQREVLRLAYEVNGFLADKPDQELHALINNAGCVRSWYTTTEDGYEQQFSLNHLAGFLLTYKLFPFLQKAKGRVIMTGSQSHHGIKIHWDDLMFRRVYNLLLAYKQSKLCNLLFAKALNDRFASKGVRAYVVDPGLVKTDIGNKQTGILVNLVWSMRKHMGVPANIPAKTYAYLCNEANAADSLNYFLCKKRSISKQVTPENAKRLFDLSERLCGISYKNLELAL
ncbi:MAG: SDR family NAD(P)-dependent oxidoreductase [Anaerolineaceae bacterium]|nr:SDR family NAD(P)-dependent oxidoreductase [Anaerolineaceae bacterium]